MVSLGLRSLTWDMATSRVTRPRLAERRRGSSDKPNLKSAVKTPGDASHPSHIPHDTWSTHFENDGQQQNGPATDSGTNGVDDGGVVGVVDDDSG